MPGSLTLEWWAWVPLGVLAAAGVFALGLRPLGRAALRSRRRAMVSRVNAKLQLQALQLGEPKFLSPTEVEKCTARQMSPLGMDRAWEYWVSRIDSTGV